jgi:hypothetical protein
MKKECAEKSKDVMGAMDGKKTQAGARSRRRTRKSRLSCKLNLYCSYLPHPRDDTPESRSSQAEKRRTDPR